MRGDYSCKAMLVLGLGGILGKQGQVLVSSVYIFMYSNHIFFASQYTKNVLPNNRMVNHSC